MSEISILLAAEATTKHTNSIASPYFSRQEWPKQCVLIYWILQLLLSLGVHITFGGLGEYVTLDILLLH
jgi:hypothetical protein